MNSCHVCSTIAKKQQITACDNCDNLYCMKCLKQIISSQCSGNKLLTNEKHSVIKEKKLNKRWSCFACSKNCPCKQCMGIGISNIEKQLLQKKQKNINKRNILQYQESFKLLEIFRNQNFQSLSEFQKQYFMNKVQLYCKQKPVAGEHTGIIKKYLQPLSAKKAKQKQEIVQQNVIMIESDQNNQNIEKIQIEQQNQEENSRIMDQEKIQQNVVENKNEYKIDGQNNRDLKEQVQAIQQQEIRQLKNEPPVNIQNPNEKILEERHEQPINPNEIRSQNPQNAAQIDKIADP